jgi:hypothetical protein
MSGIIKSARILTIMTAAVHPTTAYFILFEENGSVST